LEPFIETPQYVEYQGAIADWFTKVSEGISHALHLAAERSPWLRLRNSASRSSAIVSMNDVEELGGDGGENPRDHNAVHAVPGRVRGAGLITEDMIFQGVPSEGEEMVAAPLGVVEGLEVEDDGDQVFDVLNRAGLAV